MAKSEKKLGQGLPRTRLHVPERAAAKGTKEGEEKYSLIIKTELLEKMKNITYWERLTIKDTFEEAAIYRVKKYEKKSGPLKSVPNKG
ncbi:MAG TPA: hypothetical protein VII28_01335 [Puia sp.]